jgi:hypothetical protein
MQPGVIKVRGYVNEARQRAIREIMKAQQHSLDMYELNKLDYNVDRRQMDAAKLEELRSRLFADKFCFVIEIELIDRNKTNRCLFQLFTVVTFWEKRNSQSLM